MVANYTSRPIYSSSCGYALGSSVPEHPPRERCFVKLMVRSSTRVIYIRMYHQFPLHGRLPTCAPIHFGEYSPRDSLCYQIMSGTFQGGDIHHVILTVGVLLAVQVRSFFAACLILWWKRIVCEKSVHPHDTQWNCRLF